LEYFSATGERAFVAEMAASLRWWLVFWMEFPNFWIGKGRSEWGSEIPDAVLGSAVAATCGERLKGRELVGPP